MIGLRMKVARRDESHTIGKQNGSLAILSFRQINELPNGKRQLAIFENPSFFRSFCPVNVFTALHKAKERGRHSYDNLTKTPTIVFETVLSRASFRSEQ